MFDLLRDLVELLSLLHHPRHTDEKASDYENKDTHQAAQGEADNNPRLIAKAPDHNWRKYGRNC